MKTMLRGEEADRSIYDTTFPCSPPQAAQDVKMCHGTTLFQRKAFFYTMGRKTVIFKMLARIQQKHETELMRADAFFKGNISLVT